MSGSKPPFGASVVEKCHCVRTAVDHRSASWRSCPKAVRCLTTRQRELLRRCDRFVRWACIVRVCVDETFTRHCLDLECSGALRDRGGAGRECWCAFLQGDRASCKSGSVSRERPSASRKRGGGVRECRCLLLECGRRLSARGDRSSERPGRRCERSRRPSKRGARLCPRSGRACKRRSQPSKRRARLCERLDRLSKGGSAASERCSRLRARSDRRVELVSCV